MSVDSDKIELTVEDGLVTLEGDVDSKYEVQAAIKNAYEGGAKVVKNELTINETPQSLYSQAPGFFTMKKSLSIPVRVRLNFLKPCYLNK